MLKRKYPKLHFHCYAFGPAALLSEKLAEEAKSCVTTIVNLADIVPRLCLGSVLDLKLLASSALKDCDNSYLNAVSWLLSGSQGGLGAFTNQDQTSNLVIVISSTFPTILSIRNPFPPQIDLNVFSLPVMSTILVTMSALFSNLWTKVMSILMQYFFILLLQDTFPILFSLVEPCDTIPSNHTNTRFELALTQSKQRL